MEAALTALLINALPLFSVFLFGWNALTLLILYWLENIVIGAFNVLKMLLSGANLGTPGILISLFLVAFFIFHYGLFCAVHGAFIWAMFAGIDGMAGSDPVNLPGAVLGLLRSDETLFWNVVLMGAFQFYLFLRFWVVPRRWRDSDPMNQMFEPYPRIIVVHFTIMLSAIPVLLLGQPLIAVAVLAVLKTALEVRLVRWGQMPRVDFDVRRALADMRAGRDPS